MHICSFCRVNWEDWYHTSICWIEFYRSVKLRIKTGNRETASLKAYLLTKIHVTPFNIWLLASWPRINTPFGHQRTIGLSSQRNVPFPYYNSAATDYDLINMCSSGEKKTIHCTDCNPLSVLPISTLIFPFFFCFNQKTAPKIKLQKWINELICVWREHDCPGKNRRANLYLAMREE